MSSSLTFALVSDTHLGKLGKHAERHMKQAVNLINRSSATFTVFCGDLVDNGLRPERRRLYARWRRLADSLRRPWFAIPGNHDDIDPFRRHVSRHVRTSFTRGTYRFVCLHVSDPFTHDGVIDHEQTRWVDQKLKQAAREKRQVVIVSHITAHENSAPDRGWWIRPEKGGKGLTEVIRRHAQHVAAWFAGHNHCGLRGWHDRFGMHEIVLPSTSFNGDRGLAEAPGWAHPNVATAYVHVTLNRRELLLDHIPLESPDPERITLTIPK